MFLLALSCTIPLQASYAQTYTGKPISISVRSLPLEDFFRLIAELSKKNVVIHPKASGKITLHLKDVAWDQALAIVLAQHQLVSIIEGNILYIVPATEVRNFYR